MVATPEPDTISEGERQDPLDKDGYYLAPRKRMRILKALREYWEERGDARRVAAIDECIRALVQEAKRRAGNNSTCAGLGF